MCNQSHSVKRYQTEDKSINKQNDKVEPNDRVSEKVNHKYFSTDTEVDRYDKDGKCISNNFWQIILQMCDSDNIESDSQTLLFLVEKMWALHN